MRSSGLEHLFAGWRIGQPRGVGGDGRPHVDPEIPDGLSLFEAIEQSGRPDEETYILRREANSFAILNVFPYTTGHVLVLPTRAVAGIDDLDDETYVELWLLVRDVARAVTAAFAPDGLNIGVNEGTAGGGSIPDHLHVHVVPRWSADTNFMTSVANTRVLPLTLVETWNALRDSWPGPGEPDAPGRPGPTKGW
ncbi:MAG: HIT domain-containing protein [Acidimicrobiia bacterium]|nr:HIT domain-containing protein [Acidimicrobiia bacterium]